MTRLTSSKGTVFKSKRKNGEVCYCAELIVGYYVNGEPQKTRRTFDTKGEAIRGLNRLVAQREAGELGVVRAETVEHAALRWIREVKASKVRASTLSDYECKLRTYLFPYLGNRKLSSITGRDIDLWMTYLARDGKSTSTIAGARRVAFGFFKYAHRQGLITVNPVALTDAPKRKSFEQTHVQEPWTIEETLKALNCACSAESEQFKDLELFLTIGLFLGLRRGEILGLQWKDIDFENNYLHVRRTLKEQRVLTKSGKGAVSLVIDVPKTKSSVRTLPLAPQTRKALERQLMRRDIARVKAGESWVNEDWVFTTKNGTAVHPSNMRVRFLRFIKTNNLRSIRIHDLRHTSAVLALTGGIALEAVSQALGHSRLDITKDVYAPNVPKLNEEFGYSLASFIEAEQAKDAFNRCFSESLNIFGGSSSKNWEGES